MSDQDPQREADSGEPKPERPAWQTLALVSGLGGEFVGSVVGGLFVGHMVDERMGWAPVGLLVGGALGMAAVSVHVMRIMRRLGADSEGA